VNRGIGLWRHGKVRSADPMAPVITDGRQEALWTNIERKSEWSARSAIIGSSSKWSRIW